MRGPVRGPIRGPNIRSPFGSPRPRPFYQRSKPSLPKPTVEGPHHHLGEEDSKKAGEAWLKIFSGLWKRLVG